MKKLKSSVLILMNKLICKVIFVRGWLALSPKCRDNNNKLHEIIRLGYVYQIRL